MIHHLQRKPKFRIRQSIQLLVLDLRGSRRKRKAERVTLIKRRKEKEMATTKTNRVSHFVRVDVSSQLLIVDFPMKARFVTEGSS